MSKVRLTPGRHRSGRRGGRESVTLEQRRQLLASFRAGIGAKPAVTEESEAHASAILDKLADAPIKRPRR